MDEKELYDICTDHDVDYHETQKSIRKSFNRNEAKYHAILILVAVALFVIAVLTRQF